MKIKKLNSLQRLFIARARQGLFISCAAVFFSPAWVSAKSPSKKPAVLTAVQPVDPAVALESADQSKRLEAADGLRTKKFHLSDEALKKARAKETDSLVRHRLNQALSATSGPQVAVDLMDVLQNDPSPLVRQGAAQTLGNYTQNPAVVKALAHSLERETEPAIRYACALSLGLSGSFKSMRALEKFMDDEDPNLRRQIAYMFTRQKNVRSKILLKKMAHDSDPSVRAMAVMP